MPKCSTHTHTYSHTHTHAHTDTLILTDFVWSGYVSRNTIKTEVKTTLSETIEGLHSNELSTLQLRQQAAENQSGRADFDL